MTAAARVATPVLRTAAGEPPLGRDAAFFRDEQGEIFEHDNPRYRSGATKLGVIELDNGRWLAQPPSFHVSRPQYDSRDQALRAGIAALIRRARKYMRNADGQGTQWNEGFGGRVIEWALSLKPVATKAAKNITEIIPDATGEPPDIRALGNAEADPDREAGFNGGSPMAPKEIIPAPNPNKELGVKSTLEEINDMSGEAGPSPAKTDPVVRALGDAHRARKIYPGGHTFSMTNPIVNGHMVTLGTCSCGESFSFGYDPAGHGRMDAAVEAHWQRFDHLPEKTDGRGRPIEPEGVAKPAKKSRSRKVKAADAPDLLASAHSSDGGVDGHAGRGTGGANSPVQTASSVDEQAGIKLIAGEPGPSENNQPAQICAGDEISEPAESFDPDQTAAGGMLIPSMVAEQSGELEAGETSTAGASAAVSPALLAPGEPASVEGARGHTPPEVIHYVARPMSAADEHLLAVQRHQVEQLVAVFSGTGEGVDGRVKPGHDGDGVVVGLDGGGLDDLYGVGVVGRELDEPDDLAIEWPSYDGFLEDKIVTAPLRGIEVARDSLHPYLKPHCKDLTVWGLRLGCAAIFASFGLHKTAMQLEWCRQLVKRTGMPSLSVVPLGVRHGFIKEALQLGMEVHFVRTNAEMAALRADGVLHFLTNYESIREGKLDPNLFEAVTLDEASVLRSYGSKTFQEFLPLFAKVPFKLVATATPSPNRYKELIHYAGFLGVMDTGLALTRWFQRNSEKAGDLTLYPHKEDEFWMWVHSWASFLQMPSELGHSDDGYQLPPLDLHWHEVPAEHALAQPERDGQGVMFRQVANSLSEAATARRDSLAARIGKMMEIIAQDPDDSFLIWHDLNAECDAIEAALPGVVTITGSGMTIEAREALLADFEEGRTKYFATKPTLSGSGSNFQYHCHRMIFVALPGFGFKFNDFIQALHRLLRFGQAQQVRVDIIYAEDERAGRAALEGKWALDTEMRQRMSRIIRAHGLNTLPLRDALKRTLGVQRIEFSGKGWVAINNDAVAECGAWPDNSVDLMVTSIPFGNQYEYSASYRDFGHSDDSGHFWGQMDFLTPDLKRMLKPGRLACIHVKDRVLFGAVTGKGVPTVSPFHCEAVMHYMAHGFDYCGMITVVTDVVRENNQTYRLGWSENAKDSTKMGVGMPEYILLLRKPQSDRSRSYADVPVTKVKPDLFGGDDGGYSRARWQLDAHALWRSSGNRLLTPEEFASLESADHARMFAKLSTERVYDFEAHVRIGENLERQGTLPATFMSIAPGSHHADVWHDVNRMRTLNMLQQRKGAEMHLCPLQFDIVDRLIERYSNAGDMVFDPFGGLMTVPYRAILKQRRGAATELSAAYCLDGVKYLQMAEERMATPNMFDLMAFDAATSPKEMEAETDG